jgi:hypothetical protein
MDVRDKQLMDSYQKQNFLEVNQPMLDHLLDSLIILIHLKMHLRMLYVFSSLVIITQMF